MQRHHNFNKNIRRPCRAYYHFPLRSGYFKAQKYLILLISIIFNS